MTDNLSQQINHSILNSDTFISAEFRRPRTPAVPWQEVTVRPVLIRNERLLQFSYFDGQQVVARNYTYQDAEPAVDELLALPFKSVVLQATTGTTRIQYSKKGRPIVHQDAETQPIPLPLAHDRPKPYLLDAEDPAPFLRAIGVATEDGRIRAGQQRKFRQINEFLRLLADTGVADNWTNPPIRIVDLGCGNAALTFATYHYVQHELNIPVRVTGVDVKQHLIDKHNATVDQLGWENIEFVAGRIVDYKPETRPDVVIALHACDTATDEALAQGIRANSKLILSAPCCHHHLQAQLGQSEPPAPFAPVTRHGILRERLGDILTDAFRAQILMMLGYRTDVIEFIAVSHTPKNLMIRAVHSIDSQPDTTTAVTEYKALKDYWGVTPYLETLLSGELRSLLTDD